MVRSSSWTRGAATRGHARARCWPGFPPTSRTATYAFLPTGSSKPTTHKADGAQRAGDIHALGRTATDSDRAVLISVLDRPHPADPVLEADLLKIGHEAYRLVGEMIQLAAGAELLHVILVDAD